MPMDFRNTRGSVSSHIDWVSLRNCSQLSANPVSDIPTDGAQSPQWRELYQAALFELNARKSLKLIAEAHSAILDQIGDGFSKPSNAEQVSLRNALEMLRRLRTIAEDEISKQKKTA